MHSEIVIGAVLGPGPLSASQIIRGIASFTTSQPRWRVQFATAAEFNRLKAFVGECDGLIGFRNKKLAELVRKAKRPMVAILDSWDMPGYPLVVPDERRIGSIGASHLLSRGFKRFGFFGYGEEWSRGRQDGFVQRLREAGFKCTLTGPIFQQGSGGDFDHLCRPDHVRDYLRRFDPPAGIMAMNDFCAQCLIAGCRHMGLRVPEDIAIVGVDNDLLACVYSAVPLTSIDVNLEGVGYEAAALLDRLMRNAASAGEKILVEPGKLFVRKSTATVAITDPDAAAAVRFMEKNACSGIDVDDVLNEIPMSRRALERMMRKELNRTPLAYMRDIRMAKVCELLKDTQLSLTEIASRTGFQYRTYMSIAFRRQFGETPRQYRNKHQKQSEK